MVGDMDRVDDQKVGSEGKNMLGKPRFKKLDNGRLKCVETGHELLPADRDMYSGSKRCRLGLIDFAVSKNRPPLNMFKHDPLNRSRLICKLTGDPVNKSEEHIWKHLNGRRFLNKLELMEAGKLDSNGEVSKNEEVVQIDDMEKKTNVKKKNHKKKKKQRKVKGKEELISSLRGSKDNDSDSEESDFWIPPEGDRWDHDDGKDRWGSNDGSGEDDDDDEDGKVLDDNLMGSEEMSNRTKRLAIQIESSDVSLMKKSKTSSQS